MTAKIFVASRTAFMLAIRSLHLQGLISVEDYNTSLDRYRMLQAKRL